MKISKDVNLSECTSFATGGRSEVFAVAESIEDVLEILKTQPKPFCILGNGANSLISDKGLPGTTIHMNMKNIDVNDTKIVSDAGSEWDELVKTAIANDLWGLELMSGIPGTVGAAVVGNIAAYGEAVSDSLEWVEVVNFDLEEPSIQRIPVDDLELTYRSSKLVSDSNNIIIMRACFQLSKTPTTELKYESAAKVARELGIIPNTLANRRDVIMEARHRAGSLLNAKDNLKTAGSFFKNPMVSPEKAEEIMNFEEHNVSKDALKKQNLIHGGSTTRVSAALVVLAAGFKRGQEWGQVRIHPEHALKLENMGGATSQDIYNVAQEIIKTAKSKLDVNLETEVRFLGDFS